MRMLEKDTSRRPQSMAEFEALLLEAQIDARIHTPWDEELTLPPMESDRAARISRRLSPTARGQRVSLLAVSAVAALSVGLTVFFATREPETPSVPAHTRVGPAAGATAAIAESAGADPSPPGLTTSPIATTAESPGAAAKVPGSSVSPPVTPDPVPTEAVPSGSPAVVTTPVAGPRGSSRPVAEPPAPRNVSDTDLTFAPGRGHGPRARGPRPPPARVCPGGDAP